MKRTKYRILNANLAIYAIKKPDNIYQTYFTIMGRNTGLEPVRHRFTAGCVKPLHQFRQRDIV